MRGPCLAGAVWLGLSVPAPAAIAEVPTQPPRAVHEVKRGETLWLIAQNTVGDGALWPLLYRANRDQIKDPERVYPGQRLAIPEIGPEERQAAREAAAPAHP